MDFIDMWTGREKTGQDCSNKYIRQFVEIPPYAKDEKGKFINESSKTILKEIEPFDMDEYIQSFKEDTDIYAILKKFNMSGDISLLNVKQGFYDDISDLPDNHFDLEHMNEKITMAYNDYLEKNGIVIEEEKKEEESTQEQAAKEVVEEEKK